MLSEQALKIWVKLSLLFNYMNYINKLSYCYSDLPYRQLRIVWEKYFSKLISDLPYRQLRIVFSRLSHFTLFDLPYRQLKTKKIDSMFKLM